jgi:ligand-binding SRPBCC domain-containing protein
MVIRLDTFIAAPLQLVFELSLNIDLHKISTAHTGEDAIYGKTSGYIGLHETVTWHAKHLFKWRTMTNQVVKLEAYNHFTDQMIEGDFKCFVHHHYFKPSGNGTMMRDVLDFESPYGWLGKIVDILFMKTYLKKLLIERNRELSQFATSGEWRKLQS